MARAASCGTQPASPDNARMPTCQSDGADLSPANLSCPEVYLAQATLSNMLTLFACAGAGMYMPANALMRTRRPPQTPITVLMSKGFNTVALVEQGSGCCHGVNSTKAAIRACNDAIEWNSVKVRTIIPGGYDALRLHVHIGVPNPETLDVALIKACFPYGRADIQAVEGGLRSSSRAGLAKDEPPEGLMTIANACVTVGYHTDNAGDPPPPPPAAAAAAPLAPPTSAPAPPPAPPRDTAGLSSPPTAEELSPGSPEMLARASLSQAKWSDRVLTPLETFALLGDEDGVEIFDVRTTAQRTGHEINGRAGVGVMGAASVPLDDLVSGAVELPPPDMRVVLVCSRGPKSLVALDYLAERCPRAVCVEGGVTAWQNAKLPTEDVA